MKLREIAFEMGRWRWICGLVASLVGGTGILGALRRPSIESTLDPHRACHRDAVLLLRVVDGLHSLHHGLHRAGGHQVAAI